MRGERWSEREIPDLTGRTMIVTGANSGLGYETSRTLAAHGAHVILACRDVARARDAIGRIRSSVAGASLEAIELDLAQLDSIRAFAKRTRDGCERLDALCNNAGVMAIPCRRTVDAFEMQLGTNHLGHFALTGLLLDRLLQTPGSRVVTLSSTLHSVGRIRFDDLQSERRYGRWQAYAQSKLANLLFAYELQRRLEARGAETISVACHPGYAATNLQLVGPRMEESRLMVGLSRLGNILVAQGADRGALPSLYALTASDVRGGDYIGPGGIGELRGPPRKVGSSRRSRDPAAAAHLWEVSEQLTGVRYP
ncbi:MAG: oxidoreductase [Myxococcota bacterium]